MLQAMCSSLVSRRFSPLTAGQPASSGLTGAGQTASIPPHWSNWSKLVTLPAPPALAKLSALATGKALTLDVWPDSSFAAAGPARPVRSSMRRSWRGPVPIDHGLPAGRALSSGVWGSTPRPGNPPPGRRGVQAREGHGPYRGRLLLEGHACPARVSRLTRAGPGPGAVNPGWTGSRSG